VIDLDSALIMVVCALHLWWSFMLCIHSDRFALWIDSDRFGFCVDRDRWGSALIVDVWTLRRAKI
jgi:hypothetical protein